MTNELPKQGFVFWPVGTGDSTTVAVGEDVVLHVDLNHMAQAEEEDDPHTPIVDVLVEVLPHLDKTPYLATFALTHPDQDHCRGFADLLKRVHIGELWFTPRIFREYKTDLCDDAQAFQKEALRRVRATVEAEGDPGSGDRVRIIGYDELLKDEEFEGFPKDRLTIPGGVITELDGRDMPTRFRAFVHSPFKDDSDGERNDTSLGLQVTLSNGKGVGQALLFGDLCYPTLRRIFDRSKAADLLWNVLLAPHHCSKSAMYWQVEGEDEETLKQDILDSMEKAEASPGYVVSSSDPIPASNKPGDNPPHAVAKARYEEIANDGFLCTQEHPDEKEPVAIVFVVDDSGLTYLKPESQSKRAASAISTAVAAARGGVGTPTERVGFGR